MNLDVLLTMAKAMEIVDVQEKIFAHTINRGMLPETVSKIDMKMKLSPKFPDSSNKRNDNECSRCGYKGHFASDLNCPAKGKICNGCNGKDHFHKKCNSKQITKNWRKRNIYENRNYQNKRYRKENTIKNIVEDDESKKLKLKKTEYVFCIDIANEISCKIGGVDVKAIVDSGLKYNIVSVDFWEEWKLKDVVVFDMLKNTDKTFKSYGNHPLSVIGTFKVEIDAGKTKTMAEFYVVKEAGKTLIGLKTGQYWFRDTQSLIKYQQHMIQRSIG